MLNIELPANHKIEKQLIGCIISYPGVMEIVRPILGDGECFDSEEAKELYDICNDLFNLQQTISFETVLHKIKYQSAKGDLKYLMDSLQDTVMPLDSKTYAMMIFELYMKRQIVRAGLTMINNAKNSDPFDLKSEAEEMINKLNIQSQGLLTMKQVASLVKDRFKKIEEGKLTGIITGIKELDYHTGGLQKTDLIVIGSYPSNGKTATALNVFVNIALGGGVGKYYTFEMSAEQLAIRMMGIMSGYSTTDLELRKMYETQGAKIALDYVRMMKGFIDNKCSNINQLIADATYSVKMHNVQYIIIDYLQLMTSHKSERYDSISYIVDRLKQLAMELNIPIILISQLSRPEKGYKKGPRISDLKESGNIENSADIVWLPWIPIKEPTEATVHTFRGDEYETTKEEKWLMQHNIAKGRNYGTTKWLSYISPSNKIEPFIDAVAASIDRFHEPEPPF